MTRQRRQLLLKKQYLVEVSDIFYFFLLGGGEGGVRGAGRGGGGKIFTENPRRGVSRVGWGGGAEGPGGCLRGICQRIAKGAGGKGPRQKTSKSVKKFFDTFRQFWRRAKNVKNRQKASKIFSTFFDNFRAAPVFRPLLGSSDRVPRDEGRSCRRYLWRSPSHTKRDQEDGSRESPQTSQAAPDFRSSVAKALHTSQWL